MVVGFGDVRVIVVIGIGCSGVVTVVEKVVEGFLVGRGSEDSSSGMVLDSNREGVVKEEASSVLLSGSLLECVVDCFVDVVQ